MEEQGECCTPKFSLPYSSRFVKNHLPMVQDCSRDCTVKLLHKAAEIRVLVLSSNMRFSMVQSSLIGPYTSSSTYMPSFKTHSANLHSQKPHLIYNQLQGQNGHFAVKSQNFWSTSYFEFTIIILSSLDHDFHKNGSKIIKVQKLLFLDNRRVNCILTRA